jgi:predicted RNA-binding Zn-ribbon protein involved in translation (DUF1610 family)
MKNTIYAIIIVACLVVASVVIFTTRSGSRNVGVPNSQLTWVKCLTCGDTRQMSLKGFWKQQRAEMSARDNAMPSPCVTCAKCGKDTLAEAFKCPKCGVISRKGSLGLMEYDDRCPKCGFSQVEAEAKARAESNQP